MVGIPLSLSLSTRLLAAALLGTPALHKILAVWRGGGEEKKGMEKVRASRKECQQKDWRSGWMYVVGHTRIPQDAGSLGAGGMQVVEKVGGGESSACRKGWRSGWTSNAGTLCGRKFDAFRSICTALIGGRKVSYNGISST